MTHRDTQSVACGLSVWCDTPWIRVKPYEGNEYRLPEEDPVVPKSMKVSALTAEQMTAHRLRGHTPYEPSMLFLLTGWAFARDGKKATVFNRHCEALGVHFDLESSGEHVLRVNNASKRAAEICDQIQLVFREKKMDNKLALQLRGRLGFADTFLHGRFGALLMKHLIDHAYSSSINVSEELFHVLTALFIRMRDNKAKEVRVSSTDYKYILHTDASYENGTGGIGGVLIDSSGSVVRWFSH